MKLNICKNENQNNCNCNCKFKYKSVAWICTTIAVCTALYLTRNANCLWAFFIPYFLN